MPLLLAYMLIGSALPQPCSARTSLKRQAQKQREKAARAEKMSSADSSDSDVTTSSDDDAPGNEQGGQATEEDRAERRFVSNHFDVSKNESDKRGCGTKHVCFCVFFSFRSFSKTLGIVSESSCGLEGSPPPPRPVSRDSCKHRPRS